LPVRHKQRGGPSDFPSQEAVPLLYDIKQSLFVDPVFQNNVPNDSIICIITYNILIEYVQHQQWGIILLPCSEIKDINIPSIKLRFLWAGQFRSEGLIFLS